ncbi:DUF6475 domain-containing protein [Comamonas terrigena]|uniref:DUF6475 domain-containing protein n=1 Tax=Comamonas terrigena TaxID=32013 RepID=UPI002897E64E|nr:DUF6475 domain-containing protein [Comamonas terrigena]
MRADEMPAFKDLLTDAMAYYGKDCSAFTLTVWWGALQGCELELVATALQRHAMDPERGQFAPKVADLVRVLQGTSTDRAALAWGKVHEAMSAVGAYRDVVFDDPAIHAVVEDLGGWPKVCRTETKELSYLQHRFQEAHRAYTARGQFEYQRRLAGDRSPDYEYTRNGLPAPRPALVGEPDRAIAVIKNGNAAGKTLISTLPEQAMGLLANTTLQEARA